MANIIRRREPAEIQRSTSSDPFRGWDPIQRVRDLLGWDPFAQMETYFPNLGTPFVPDVEVRETKDALVFTADLPGVKSDDVDVSVTGNRLTISGKREAEEREDGDRYFAYERTYGTFTRTFTLPEGVDPDSVKADLDSGVLAVTIAKRPEVQAKRIPLGAAQKATPAQPQQAQPQQQQAQQKKAA
jgi:HSP20 family protein